MTNKKHILNWAVVGLGVGEQHARRLAMLPNCHLSYLVDTNVDKAQELASVLGAEHAVTSFEDVINDPDVDALVIASFDDHHYAQVIAGLEAGKHLFVEKPLCHTLQELRHIKQVWLAQKGNIKLSSNLILRAAPVFGWLKSSLEEEEMGRIYSFDGEYLYGRIHKITEGWRKDVKDYSVMHGGGVHLIDLMLWLTGERPEYVYSTGNRISTEDTAFRYYDFVVSTFEFPSSLIGRIAANFGCVHRHQHIVRCFGTKATFFSDDSGPRWHESREPATPPRNLDLGVVAPNKGDLIPNFVSAILTDADLTAHTQTIFDGISLCAASDEALDRGTKVRISYI